MSEREHDESIMMMIEERPVSLNRYVLTSIAIPNERILSSEILR